MENNQLNDDKKMIIWGILTNKIILFISHHFRYMVDNEDE